MKVKSLSLLAGAGSLLLAGGANADFLGLDVIDFSGWFSGTGASPVLEDAGYVGQTTGAHPSAAVHASFIAAGVRTFRIYAMLDAGDEVAAVGGFGTTNATMTWMTASSGNFYNYFDAGYNQHFNTAPNLPLNNVAQAYDTFATVGRTGNDGETSFAPSAGDFAATTNNMGFESNHWNSFTGNSNVGWFVAGNPAQAMAAGGSGVAGHGNWGVAEDGILRVLVAQVTVDAGADVEGNLGFLGGFLAGGGLGTWEAFGDSTYFNTVPAPGALALLGLAGLAGVRRRRA